MGRKKQNGLQKLQDLSLQLRRNFELPASKQRDLEFGFWSIYRPALESDWSWTLPFGVGRLGSVLLEFRITDPDSQLSRSCRGADARADGIF